MNTVLCSIATYGRYDTTLPLVLMAVANQTKPPNKVIIFDDNEERRDLRNEFVYRSIFSIFDAKGIPWEVAFAHNKGQHHIHQMANRAGYDWVWRVDDDCIPEPTVLQVLTLQLHPNVGAIGGSILTGSTDPVEATGKIENIYSEPNIQWGRIDTAKSVDHLHCSFLYRAGVVDYNLGLSRIANREETLFTYALKQKGYECLVVPGAVSWHMKNPQGGIRSAEREGMMASDERIFQNFMALKDKTIIVLNCGKGDHVVFSHVLPDIKNPEVFTCYPDVIPGRSLAEAYELFGDIGQWDIYSKMDQWRWDKPLEQAFRKFYL